MSPRTEAEVTFGGNLRSRLLAYERHLIERALQACGGHQRRAARALGLRPTTLNEKMKRFGLRPRDSGTSGDGSNEAA